VYVARGDLATAVDHYQHAIELHREENNPTGVLNCQVQLGDLRLSLGDRAGARELWSLALATLDELRLPRADAVRARLLELD
jgi:hypothetical protein